MPKITAYHHHCYVMVSHGKFFQIILLLLNSTDIRLQILWQSHPRLMVFNLVFAGAMLCRLFFCVSYSLRKFIKRLNYEKMPTIHHTMVHFIAQLYFWPRGNLCLDFARLLGQHH